MELPRRKANRLKEYDYSSAGSYFVTICTEGRRKTLCEIVGDGFPVPKESGIIARAILEQIPLKYPQVRVDHSVVMPNHIHILLSIHDTDGTGDPSPTMSMRETSGTGDLPPTLGTIIGWYKYQVTKQINEKMGTSGTKVFQRSFHDHVIRGEKDYQKIWNYIEGNPLKWAEDCFYIE